MTNVRYLFSTSIIDYVTNHDAPYWVRGLDNTKRIVMPREVHSHTHIYIYIFSCRPHLCKQFNMIPQKYQSD
jgi:hypothetical protein